MLLRDRRDFVRNGVAERHRIVEYARQCIYFFSQARRLRFELKPTEFRESAQGHLKDVAGLDIGQIKDGHQTIPRCRGVIGLANHGDDLVDV